MLGKFPLEYSTRGLKAKVICILSIVSEVLYKQRPDEKLSITKLLEFIQYVNIKISIQIRRSIIICVIYDAYVTLITRI